MWVASAVEGVEDALNGVGCIARLCALVLPPRYPLMRFYGVLAPRAKLHRRIAPTLPPTARRPCVEPPSRRQRPKDAPGASHERPPPRDR